MKTNIYYLIGLFFFQCAVCFAESPDLSYTNWGESVHGVRMAAILDTNVFTVGSSVWIHIRVQNQSTNIVHVGISNPRVDFKITLTSATGKAYIQHEYHPKAFTRVLAVSLNNNETYDSTIPLIIGKDIDVGDCTIIVSRQFRMSKSKYEISSNILKAKIAQ